MNNPNLYQLEDPYENQSHKHEMPRSEQEINKQFREFQKKYSLKNREIISLNNQAERMNADLKEIRRIEADIADVKNSRQNFFKKRSQLKELETSRQKAHEVFKYKHNVEPYHAPEAIGNLRKQAIAKNQELKPLKEKIDTIKQMQEQQEIEIKKRMMLSKAQTLERGYSLLY